MVVKPVPVMPRPAAATASLDALVMEVSQLKTRLMQMDGHKSELERRAAAAEKAFQDAEAQRVLAEVNARRRMGELETQVAGLEAHAAELQAQADALRALLAECKGDVQSELQAATQRVSALQQRLGRLG